MSTLNAPEAAAVLKVHLNTLMKMIHDGTLPAARIGRAYVLMEKDVVGYAEAQVVKQTSERRGLTRALPPRRMASA